MGATFSVRVYHMRGHAVDGKDAGDLLLHGTASLFLEPTTSKAGLTKAGDYIRALPHKAPKQARTVIFDH